ncbi:MAG: hypothetical protein ABI748_11875 [Dokdonella sp.]
MKPHRNVVAAWQPTLAALLGMTLMFWLAWPGFFTYDSIAQLEQVRGVLRLGDEHPPLMVLIWGVLDRIWPIWIPPRPGAMFALIVAGYWTALATLVWRLFLGSARRWLVFLLIALWPPAFIVLCHVWKDGLTVVFLLAACASIVHWRHGAGRTAFGLAVLWMIVAACLRHNAVLAAVPLAIWLSWKRSPDKNQTAAPNPDRNNGSWMSNAAICITIILVMATAPLILARTVNARPGHIWTIVALWDLAGISVNANQIVIPSSEIIGTLNLGDLTHGAYVPWSAGSLFDTGKIRLSYEQDFSRVELATLRNAWLHEIVHHPAAYLKHRFAFARYQFLGYPNAIPAGLVFSPSRLELSEMPVHLPAVDMSAPWLRFMEWLRPTPVFAGLLYVATAIGAAVIAWRRRRGCNPVAVFALSASALANALPLFFISPSADFRYLIWSVLASLLALTLALQPPPREDAMA